MPVFQVASFTTRTSPAAGVKAGVVSVVLSAAGEYTW